MYEGNKKTRDDHRRQRGLSPRRTASNNNNHNGSSSSLTGLNAINSRLIHRASARSSTTSSSSSNADLLDDASNQSHGNSSSSRLGSIGVGRATSMSSPFGSRDPTANSRRSHIRRSQSFKRTAGGSTPPAASSLLGGMTPQELLGSSDHDLLGSDSNMSVGAAAALATNTAERMTRPRLTSNTSGTSIGSNSSVPGSISTAPTTTGTTTTTTGTSFASKSTSTRQFVKNFLEDYDDDYDVSGKVGGGSSSNTTTTTTNQGTTQFDAQAQRNVHRSLLNPSYDQQDGDAAARKFKAGRVPSLSSQKESSKNNNNNNLFERHQDFYTIDQSVNLMDAEAGKYESKQNNNKGSVQQMMHQSMVEIFLQDLSPSSTQDGKTKKSRSATGPWYHPHRQAQWDRMSTWEKVVDVAARLLIPLFLCAMVGLVVLVIVVVYYGSTVPSSSNEVASASATSSSTPIDVVPTLPEEPEEPTALEEEPTDQVAAMTTLLSELSLVTPEDLQDPKSAPSKALNWIAKDTIALAGLPVNGRRQLGAQQAEEQLVQRFVLAVLYYEWMPKQVGGNVQVAAAAARDSMSLEPGHAGPSGQAKTQGLWLSAQSECNWKGISCHDDVEDLRARATTTIDRSGPATTISASASSSHVRKLNLTGHELTGTLPSILTALEQLHELDLRHNQIGGSLHELDWTKWAHLEYLLLGDNRITGHLPWQFPALQKIVDMDLSNNQLTGKLPALSDGQDPLVELENLFLDGNALTGSIPDSFLRDMPHITYIDVSQNQLEGKLPFDALAELSELRFLHLSGNQLTGELPPRMSKKLDTLSLGQNKLAGDVPDSLISDVKRLRHLELSQNDFQGPLPERLGELTHLKDLQLDRNQFSGDVPVWDALTHLETLKLHGNKLSGEVPDAVCAIDSSQSLQITADCDTGSIKCDCCDQCY